MSENLDLIDNTVQDNSIDFSGIMDYHYVYLPLNTS